MRTGNDKRDLEFLCNADIPPLVPNGEYEVFFLRAIKRDMWKRDKLFLWFRIVTAGEWNGQDIYMVCNVAHDGRWTPSCKFYLAWVLAAGRRPNRRDRLSTNVFRNKIFRARVKVVTTTAKRVNRTPEQQYSVIDDLLEVCAGSDCHTMPGITAPTEGFSDATGGTSIGTGSGEVEVAV
jgi:hypothetical protein